MKILSVKTGWRVLGFSLLSLGVSYLITAPQPAQAAAPPLPICMSGNGTAAQPSGTLYRFVTTWQATIPTMTSTCVLNDPANYPQTNGSLQSATNEQNGSNAKDYLCGFGPEWIVNYPAANNPVTATNYSTYKYCYKDIHFVYGDSFIVADQNNQVLVPGQHIQVGEPIQIIMLGGTGANSTDASEGPYVNRAKNSYYNSVPAGSNFQVGQNNTDPPIYLHCSGTGSAPLCAGVFNSGFGYFNASCINNGLTCNAGTYGSTLNFSQFTNAVVAVTAAGYPSTMGVNANIGSPVQMGIVPGAGWASGWTHSRPGPNTQYGPYNADIVTLTPAQSGNLSFTLSDPGGVAAITQGTYQQTDFIHYGPYTIQFGSQGIQYNAVPVATITIPVDAPADNPPNTPLVSCVPASINTAQNTTVTFSATDADAGDQVRFDIDPNYNGTSFNPTVSIPVSGYVASGASQNLPLQWATAGTKKVAVRAQDTHYQNSAVATCTVTVTSVPPPTLPNLQLATDSTGVSYTDNVVYYSLSQDAWTAAGASVTIPAQYIGNSTYQSCVLRTYPLASQGTTSYQTTATWDAWPVVPSGNLYAPVPAAQQLKITGKGTTAPAIGTILDEYFAFGCGTNTQTSQGEYTGAPDIQEIQITVTAPQSPTARVSLLVTDTGNTSGQGYVSAPLSSPYSFSEKIAASGGYTTGSSLQLKWQASNIASCTFTRTDSAGLQGAFNSSQNWNGGTTSSLFTSTDQGTLTFSPVQVQPTATIGFTLSCTGSYGSASSTVYVAFQRTNVSPQNTVFSGTVFNDLGGVLGVQDSGEAGIAGQQIKLTISNYPAGPVSYTTTSDASGNYSFTITPTNAMLQTGLATITQVTALPNGWVFTTPLTGTYSNYAIQNGTTSIFNFAERSQPATYSTFTGQVYNDANGNGVLDSSEVGIANQKVQLSRVTTFVSGSPTTETLESGLTDANGTYSVSSFVPNPPTGSLSVTYILNQVALPGPGWQYSVPINGTATFTATPNTVYHQNFGEISPIIIQGVSYIDQSGAGVSSGQPRLAGVVLQVFDITTNAAASFYNLSPTNPAPNTPVTAVTTASDGTYSIALSMATSGHLIQVREKTRLPAYPYCTNPGEGSAPAPDSAKYCEYPTELAGPYTGATGAVTLTRDFGNSSSANTTVIVVSGRIYQDKDGVPGFNPQFDNPQAAVQVTILDTTGATLATAQLSDASGYYSYSVAKNSADYNALLGKRIIIRETAPTGFTPASPSGGAYPPTQFNGSGLSNYDFVNQAAGGGTGNNPPDTSIFCALN